MPEAPLASIKTRSYQPISMQIQNFIPNIILPQDPHQKDAITMHYREIARETLQTILPPTLFSSSPPTAEEIEQFHLMLPLIVTTPPQQLPGSQSFYILAKYRFNAFKFFFEMISHWLIPNKRLDIVLTYAVDIKIENLGSEVYTLCEMMIHVSEEQEQIQIQNNFPMLREEISLGFSSSYYARKILELKGVAADDKTTMIQEYVSVLIRRYPKIFDIDLLEEMQHILLICRKEFKVAREISHLRKIIAIQYLFKKKLRLIIKNSSVQRHLLLKIFFPKFTQEAEVHCPLSLLIGVNFLNNKEHFEKRQILKGITDIISDVRLLEGSFFTSRQSSEPISLYYLEIEKSNSEKFTQDEIDLLKKKLPKALQERIEQSVSPIFMPRNEEEIMRNIIALSNQIRSLKDIPQVTISFDEQTDSHLTFTVLIVRVAPPGVNTIQEIFHMKAPEIEYIHDRVKMVGLLRKKYTKEATVFRLLLPKEPFLRLNNSIDLYKARLDIVHKLSSILGEFRDFNGGMIAKQSELLSNLKELLANGVNYSELLLESFFFSLSPVSMQTVLEPEALKTLFQILINSIEGNTSSQCHYRMRQGPDFIFLVVKTSSLEQVSNIKKALDKFNVHTSELAHSSVKIQDIYYDGYIYRCDDPTKQQLFLQEAQCVINRLSHMNSGF